MKKIPLTQGKFALVDDEDYERLMQWNWQYHPSSKGVARSLFMHEAILGKKEGKEIDHIDGNPLNNCRANLRHCTHSQNMQHQLHQKGRSSKYRGVSWSPRGRRWQASIGHHRKLFWLGYFDTEKEAAEVYDVKATKLFGEFARLNFLERKE